MSNQLQDKGFQIIAERSLWEKRQRLYYLLRHDGLRRINKPGPWAADQHMPIIDNCISSLKPFWSAQVFGGTRLCDFVSMRGQLADTTESAADFHDFQLRHRTNYRYKMEQSIDTMLLRGRGVLLATTNPFRDHKIEFQSIDPLYILMAQQYDDFDDADYWIWVQTLSVEQYRRNRNYDQSADVINAIKGKKDYTLESSEYDKQLREGVTHSSRDNEIVLWHHWERTESGFNIKTFSPQAADKKIRDAYQCPYESGGEVSCPFNSITMEVKGEGGWYAPRGIAELNAAFEAYACTLWNNKTDAMKFGNTPLFTSENDVQNTANIRFNPGEFIPGNIRAVEMPQPAFSFDQEMNSVRGMAEQRARIPDFGITDDAESGPSNPRTATENNRIAGLQNVGADYNGEIFRNVRLSKIYKHTWGLMVQFKPRQVSYFIGDDLKELPEQALHDEYLVIPTGGPANKMEKIQRAGQRYEAFKGAPNIDQDEIAKDVISADDSRLVKRLLIPMNQKQASEAYQEDVEIGVLSMGRPVPVLPNQDHATRIMELVGYLHKQVALGEAHDPIASQRINEHLAEHFKALKEAQPQAARAVFQQIQNLEMASGQGAQDGMQKIKLPGQQEAPTTQTATSGNEPPKLSESISMKLADFYPSERAQILQQLGIKSASPQEMMQTESARAQIKQAGVKPKIEGQAE